MPLLEIQTVNKITVTVALDESIAQKVDQYDKDFLSFVQSVDGKKPEHPLRIRKPMEAAERAKRGRRSTPPATPPSASVATPKDK
jgi:hypothetical protein